MASAHGRILNTAGEVQSHAKTFLHRRKDQRSRMYAGPLPNGAWTGWRSQWGENLPMREERIVTGTAAELAELEFSDLGVLLCRNSCPVFRGRFQLRHSDDAFLRGDAP